MSEQDSYENPLKLSAALSPEEFSGVVDGILARRRAWRRSSAVESQGEPWWVPSEPEGEVIVVFSSAENKQSSGRSPHPAGCYISNSVHASRLSGCGVPSSSSHLRFGCD